MKKKAFSFEHNLILRLLTTLQLSIDSEGGFEVPVRLQLCAANLGGVGVKAQHVHSMRDGHCLDLFSGHKACRLIPGDPEAEDVHDGLVYVDSPLRNIHLIWKTQSGSLASVYGAQAVTDAILDRAVSDDFDQVKDHVSTTWTQMQGEIFHHGYRCKIDYLVRAHYKRVTGHEYECFDEQVRLVRVVALVTDENGNLVDAEIASEDRGEIWQAYKAGRQSSADRIDLDSLREIGCAKPGSVRESIPLLPV